MHINNVVFLLVVVLAVLGYIEEVFDIRMNINWRQITVNLLMIICVLLPEKLLLSMIPCVVVCVLYMWPHIQFMAMTMGMTEEEATITWWKTQSVTVIKCYINMMVSKVWDFRYMDVIRRRRKITNV